MPFPATLTDETLAPFLKNAADAARLRSTALELLDHAFAAAWRVVEEATANDCLIRVARALAEGEKQTNAGKQLATVQGGTATRAALDPLDSIRATLDRHVVRL